MIKSGLKPTVFDRRDYDFHKTFGSAVPPTFPDSYNVDLGLWQPSQNDFEPIFKNSPLPFGCTDYTQADLCADEDGELKNPILLENVTHANANGGIDIRVALTAAKKVFGRTAYFTITPTGGLDFFDSIRLAMLYTREENRSVSAGTPWFPEFLQGVPGSGAGLTQVGPDGILPTPGSLDTSRASWHNWKVAGWKNINGKPYLICKPWIGFWYGDKGYCYMSRELANILFSIRYACAFTLSKRAANMALPVDFDLIGWILSVFHWLIPNR